MTARYQQGFDYIPTAFTGAQVLAALQMEGWYPVGGAGPPFSIVAPGRFGYGRKLQWADGFLAISAAGIIKPLGYQNSAGGWVSGGLNIANNNSAPAWVGVYDAVNNIWQACVSFEANGVIRAWRGAPGIGTVVGASEAGAYRVGVDFDVEAFFVINATTGQVAVRIDTGAVLTLVNVDTQPGSNAYFDSHGFGYYAGFNGAVLNYSVDDYRVYDTVGSINNTWLGTMRVQTSLPSANGAATDFTSSNSGLANYQNIANTNIDDTLYLYDGAAGDYNLSEIQPLVNSPAVAWVGVLSFLRQDDATQITAKNRIVSGATTADGAPFLTAQSYTGDADIFETDPATSVQFTGAGVNALQVGPLLYAIA